MTEGGGDRPVVPPPAPPPKPSLRVTKQVRNINGGGSCSPLLRTCGPGYELAQARPLSPRRSLMLTLSFLNHRHQARENAWKCGGKDPRELHSLGETHLDPADSKTIIYSSLELDCELPVFVITSVTTLSLPLNHMHSACENVRSVSEATQKVWLD